MPVTIALVGNPNSGKTTVFNKITGSDQYVGNWAGVTVEKKQGRALNFTGVTITDLPGIYSLSPYSPEEVVTRTFIMNEKPDVIMIIADASNLERNLFLAAQVLEMEIPAVVILNMMDAAEKNGISIESDALSEAVGCKVYEASAVRGLGLSEAVAGAVETAGNKKIPARTPRFTLRVEKALADINKIAAAKLSRWTLIKIFERDDKISDQLRFTPVQSKKIETVISGCENDMDDDSESIITNERYAYIEKIIKTCVLKKTKTTLTEKIDGIVTNRWLALPIFALVMWLVYYISLSAIGSTASRWISNVLFRDIIYSNAAAILQDLYASPLTISLVCDAVISGVGSVLKFIPQMTILFLCLSFLEDCGYMARVAFIMDRVFRQFGLSGKSFIPLLISSGCGVPGIMASRTIENDQDRRLTIILATFIPCGAKIPLIALISTAFFPSSPWLAPLVYFTSIAAVMLSALILKKTPLFVHSDSPFLMELPQYHFPAPKNLFRHVWTRVKSFIIKAGTVIFLACVAIWFLSSFSFRNGFAPSIQEDSILADIGRFISPLFAPLGFGEWQFALATLTGIIAKENAVGTLAVLFGAGVGVADVLSVPSALSFMLFNLFCAPCVAAIAAVKKEMRSLSWTLFAVAYQTAFAYLIAMTVYCLGSGRR